MNARARIGAALRRYADRIDHQGAPRAIGWSFTFERGRGLVWHHDRTTGCPVWVYGMADYDKAYRDEEEPRRKHP